MIRSTVTENPDHSLTCLSYAIICYNNSIKNTTGFSSYELVFAHRSQRPSEKLYNQQELMLKHIRELIKKYLEKGQC